MEFRVLGPVEIRVGDAALDAGHARQRAVLAVLLLDLGRVIPADRLIDRVWGEDPPAAVRNTLSGYVARLRALLAGAAGDGVTLSRRQAGYLLHADSSRVDLHRFRRLVTQAAAAGDDGDAEPLLGEALGLWHGPALAGVDSRWLTAMRDTLELERHAALLDLNDVRLRLGQHAVLAAELASQAAAHPADERLIGQLMLALYRCGRQADALRWYEQTRRYLAGELGADPGPDLRELHRQMLRADPALAVPAAKPAAPVPRELPADVAAFTGRAAELGELDNLLLGPQHTTAAVISAVSGTAGVGKTALAVHWAYHAAESFPDGQLYVNLRGYDPGQPMAATDALATFLRSLGVPGQDIPAEEAERAVRYRSLLAGKRTLIVLDNARSVEQVRPLLPGHPGCAVVVTSRDSLAGLVARDGARRLDLDLLPLADAIALLRELVGARVDAEPDAAVALVGQCAWLPLALRIAAELAAARPRVPLCELVAELDDQQRRLDLLSVGGDPRTAVRAVFSWSYDHLDIDAARAYRIVGLHPGPDFDPHAAAALADTTLEVAGRALDALSRAHLVQPAGRGRYVMHDLLRAYARELGADHDTSDERRLSLTRLIDYYVGTAAVAMNTLDPARRHRRPTVDKPATPAPPLAVPDEALAWLDAELAVLIVVVGHAAEQGWPHHATRLAATLVQYLDSSARYAEAVSVHGHAYRAARQSGDRPAEARALTGLGGVAYHQADYAAATDYYRRAIDVLRQTGDQATEARLLHNLALVYYGQNNYEAATDLLEEALALISEEADRVGQASFLETLGLVTKRQGRYELAGNYHRRALALFRDAGDRYGEAMSLANLGSLCNLLGRHEEALRYLEQALALHRQVGNRAAEARAFVSVGATYFWQRRFEDAIEVVTAGLHALRESGNRVGEVTAHLNLGEAFFAVAQFGRSRAHFAAALGLATRIGDRHEQARAHDGLSHAYRAAGDVGQANEHSQQALTLYTELGVPATDQIRTHLAALDDERPSVPDRVTAGQPPG